MQSSRFLLLVAASTVALFPLVLSAADNEAQAKARKALEQKMSPASEPAPAPPAPAAPAAQTPAKPAAVKSQTPAAPAPAPAPAPAIAATAGGGGFWDVTVPPPTTEAQQKAEEALRQKLAELNAQAAAPPGLAAKPLQPIAAPPAPSAAGTNALDNAVNQANAAAAAALQAEQARPLPQPGVDTGLPRLPVPAPAISAEKDQRLKELLSLYAADAISPEQYHAQRAKILAQP
jgi:hypothetical protein